MLSVVMDRTVSIWRKAALTDGSGGYGDTQIYGGILVAILPLSSLDQASPYAYESTHIIWTPHWLVLRKEDQVRYGNQPPDPQNDLRGYVYTINGRRPFSLGMTETAYYAREME